VSEDASEALGEEGGAGAAPDAIGDPVSEKPSPDASSAADETPPPPPVEAGAQDMEPIVLALVFLVPPIALGGSAIALAFSKKLAWNPLAVGLVIGLVASIGFYFVVRRVFAAN
jgi:hypothetical protein